eukprot:146028_1
MGQCCGSESQPEVKQEKTTELKSESIKEESKSEAIVLRRRLSGGSFSYGQYDLKEADNVCDMLASKLSNSAVSSLEISSTVVTLPNKMASSKAVEILLQNKIRAAPVIDDNNQFVGVLDLRDTLAFGLQKYKNKSLDKVSSESLSESFKLRPFDTVKKDDSMLTVAKILANGAHIVGVVNDEGNVVGILNQREMFQLAHGLWTDPTNNCSLQELLESNIITSPIKSIKNTMSAYEAFLTMSDLKLSGLAVVNDEGILIHNTSSSDIKMWMTTGNGSLEEPIEEFLINIRKQPRQQDKYPVSYCTTKQTLKRAFQKLYATGYHRLWIVDEDNCPIGVFALTDIFKFICKNEKQLQRDDKEEKKK